MSEIYWTLCTGLQLNGDLFSWRNSGSFSSAVVFVGNDEGILFYAINYIPRHLLFGIKYFVFLLLQAFTLL